MIVVEDCVDTMDGPEHHAAALRVIGTAFGQVTSADELMAARAPKHPSSS